MNDKLIELLDQIEEIESMIEDDDFDCLEDKLDAVMELERLQNEHLKQSLIETGGL